jgi:hypothetical protein
MVTAMSRHEPIKRHRLAFRPGETMMFALDRTRMLQLAAVRAAIWAGGRSDALRALVSNATQGSVTADETGSAGFNDPAKQLTAHVDAYQSGEAAARRVS